MYKKRYDKARRRAMKNCIDKGRNPVAEVDGYISFMEAHFDGCPLTEKQRKAMDKAIADLRKANTIIDKIEVDTQSVRKGYYESNR